ncbi:MAG TPA: SCO family protein, partial [Stellaceae bacterium]|nr:SCO family protein [Stellaceae bacterium]
MPPGTSPGCPTALNNMALALDKLGTGKSEFCPVFITIDPAGDTPPAALKGLCN